MDLRTACIMVLTVLALEGTALAGDLSAARMMTVQGVVPGDRPVTIVVHPENALPGCDRAYTLAPGSFAQSVKLFPGNNVIQADDGTELEIGDLAPFVVPVGTVQIRVIDMLTPFTGLGWPDTWLEYGGQYALGSAYPPDGVALTVMPDVVDAGIKRVRFWVNQAASGDVAPWQRYDVSVTYAGTANIGEEVEVHWWNPEGNYWLPRDSELGLLVFHQANQAGAYQVDYDANGFGHRDLYAQQGVWAKIGGVRAATANDNPVIRDNDFTVIGPNGGDSVVCLQVGESAQLQALGRSEYASMAESLRSICGDGFFTVENVSGSTAYELDDLGVLTVLSPGHIRIGCERGLAPREDGLTKKIDVYAYSSEQLELAVDGNRDGLVEFDNPADKSMRFWLNDDRDVPSPSAFYQAEREDPEQVPPASADSADWVISGPRDLEDFARLHIRTAGLEELLAAGEVSIGLKWKSVEPNTGQPAIRMFKAIETDGGWQYIRSLSVAETQIQDPGLGVHAPLRCLTDSELGRSVVESNQGSGSDFVFRSDFFGQLATDKHFVIFEGVKEGKGLLVPVLIRDGAVVAEGKGVTIELRNILRLYERAHAIPSNAGQNFPFPYMFLNNDPVPDTYTVSSSGALLMGDDKLGQEPGFDGETDNYPFEPAPDEEDKCIVYVHGIYLSVDEVKSYTASFYKRLWWEGYRGRLAVYRWSTPTSDDPSFPIAVAYNRGVYASLKGAFGLRQFVDELKTQMPDAKIGVAAHSLGNACASEAFRRGMTADSYVMLEAAVSQGCYFDAVAPGDVDPLSDAYLGTLLAAEDETIGGHATPDPYTSMGYRGAFAGIRNNIGNWVNYHNEYDFWLATGQAIWWTGRQALDWAANEEMSKPVSTFTLADSMTFPYRCGIYTFAPTMQPTHRFTSWVREVVVGDEHLHDTITWIRPVEDIDESLAFVARSRTRAVGAVPSNLHATPQRADGRVNLNAVYGFDRARADHSGQFQRDVQYMYSSEDGTPFIVPLYQKLIEDLGVYTYDTTQP